MLELTLAGPDDPPDVEARRGYTFVPTHDVRMYASEQIKTFAMGALLGLAIGGTLGAILGRSPRVPATPLTGIRRRR